MTEETLLQEALSRPLEDRAAFLKQACDGKPELLATVLSRLDALEGQNLGSMPGETPAPATAEFVPGLGETTEFRPATAPETVVAGRYTLVEKIGEGGMGEVWVARQSEPVKRKVALKLIRPGMDTRSVIQRFEQERQALALMEHPGIARVIDGGMTTENRPFFVMELVNGLPLTEFCDKARLNVRERLELFASICQAVQHAHQKGIIHRDLKPTNILVTIVDGKPVPKVIDFGVAKATAGKLTDETMSTQLGAVIGTIEYMAPEQAGASGEDVDTRADIYSLGVILYELLIGLRPIDATRLKRAALTEMIRIIKEEDPSKPSTRLSTDASAPSMAALRQVEPRKLSAMLRGELDWVVMKCLEKRRDRRYETANALNRDIQRYLDDEPVEARPPSASYLLGKFLHRNQGAVFAASLVLLALVGGIIGTSLGLLEARRQERRAVLARDAETKRAEAEIRERQRAEKAEGETKKRADELEQVAEFQAKQFEGIDIPLTGVRLRADLLEKVRAAAVNAKRKPEEVDARVAEVERDVAGADFSGMALRTLEQSVLVPSLEAIEKQFAGQPLVRARLQDTLAVTSRKLGLLELAEKPQFAGAGDPSPDARRQPSRYPVIEAARGPIIADPGPVRRGGIALPGGARRLPQAIGQRGSSDPGLPGHVRRPPLLPGPIRRGGGTLQRGVGTIPSAPRPTYPNAVTPVGLRGRPLADGQVRRGREDPPRGLPGALAHPRRRTPADPGGDEQPWYPLPLDESFR